MNNTIPAEEKMQGSVCLAARCFFNPESRLKIESGCYREERKSEGKRDLPEC